MIRAVVLFATLAVACGPSREKVEAQRVLHAIDELRSAPSAELELRTKLLAKLELEPAEGKLATAAKEACATPYRLLFESTALEAKAREEVKTGAGIQGLADLDAAGKKLEASAAAMPGCDEASAALRRLAR